MWFEESLWDSTILDCAKRLNPFRMTHAGWGTADELSYYHSIESPATAATSPSWFSTLILMSPPF
jgi:hypothetical protein